MIHKKRQEQYREDRGASAGITAWFTSFYVILSIPLLTSWFTAEGFLPAVWWPWVVAGTLVLALLALQKLLYEWALDTFISGPGCLGGLFTYGVGILLCPLLFWKGGWEGLVIGILLVPLLSVGIAVLVTFVGPDSPGGGRKRGGSRPSSRRGKRR
jgi:hypothetical protein